MDKYKVLFDISKTHLLSRLKQSAIAALGVTFGIGMFITLMSFMTGLNGILDDMVLNRTPHIHIFNDIKPTETQPIQLIDKYINGINKIRSIKPKNSPERINNALPLIQELNNDERVRGATPMASVGVFYVAGPIELNGLVNGIDVIKEVELFNFQDYVVEGEPLDLVKTSNGILLGAGIAKKMSLELGDKVQVSTAAGNMLPLKIVGLFQTGLAEVDDKQSYVNIKTAQQLLGQGNNYITDINVKLYDMELSGNMAIEIEELFDLTAIDIKTANAQFETGTSIRNLITYAVSFTHLLLAGFGIYNILNMFIYEKMNDIAILKATGFSGSDVQKIFVIQALTIGVVGGILGLIIGFGLSYLISTLPFETDALPTIKTYPVNFEILYYVFGMLFAVIATFLAGFLPSLRAKNIDPVEIIRGQ